MSVYSVQNRLELRRRPPMASDVKPDPEMTSSVVNGDDSHRSRSSSTSIVDRFPVFDASAASGSGSTGVVGVRSSRATHDDAVRRRLFDRPFGGCFALGRDTGGDDDDDRLAMAAELVMLSRMREIICRQQLPLSDGKQNTPAIDAPTVHSLDAILLV